MSSNPLRAFNPSNNSAERKNDKRDVRLFWCHPSRDAKGIKWSKGETRRRIEFARLMATGTLDVGEALAQVIELRSRPIPPAWTKDEWNARWHAGFLRETGERWLLHPVVRDEARRQRKLAAAKAALRAGVPEQVLYDIVQDPKVVAGTRVKAAEALARLEQRHTNADLFSLPDAERNAAREKLEAEAPDLPGPTKDGGDGPAAA